MSSPAAPAPKIHVSQASAATLVLGALGVVFGDIGTSPLYALKECFSPEHGIAVSPANVMGLLSLITWSMAWVIAFKYLSVMMRADNNGEGGILALLALALRGLDRETRLRRYVVMLGIFGAAMFYGDSMITPAISVLSAVEGLEIATPVFSHWVIPATIAILTALFVIQRHGTASVGALFGPVTALWFLAIGATGIWRISQNPAILAAANPAHAVSFLVDNPLLGFLVLGAVFLALTGGEALYADMGHFGKRPIRIAWFGLVMPALLLNYFGQGAFVLGNPEGVKNPFYLMLPEWAVLPMVALATAATVIASQAVISGAFSMTRQAIQLGYIPRLEILHTSSRAIGQIYVPLVNWTLFVAVVLLVLGFRTSGNLANAYGIAVAATMVIECLLAIVVADSLWKWPPVATWGIIGSMLVVDLFFLASNAAKISSGGWFPLLIGAGCFTLLVTWKRGRALLTQRLSEQGIPLEPFLASLALSPPVHVPGTAIFMTGTSDTVPAALLHNLKHNKVLHDRVVFLTVVTHDVPVVPIEDRIQLKRLGDGFWKVEAWYGFKEHPDIAEMLDSCRLRYGLGFDPMETSFFLSRENIVAGERPGMAAWRDHLFAWMNRNATRATDFFNIPINRVVELGTHVDI
ncbi:MAG TPA: potassium transporter Kup [Usitatibacteraceae bacterium]|nr:potassium transporter Kup [Usitatibacteraceae bacterium]